MVYAATRDLPGDRTLAELHRDVVAGKRRDLRARTRERRSDLDACLAMAGKRPQEFFDRRRRRGRAMRFKLACDGREVVDRGFLNHQAGGLAPPAPRGTPPPPRGRDPRAAGTAPHTR